MRKETDMSGKYKVAPVSASEYVESASEIKTESGGRIERPMFRFRGANAELITGGHFQLPKASEVDAKTISVAYRVLGFVISKDLLAHLPDKVMAESVGYLGAMYVFQMHRRFGTRWTDYVCPASTRTSKCPICDGRFALFTGDEYKQGKISKQDVMGAGFGTRLRAIFFARVCDHEGVDRGICTVDVPVTNEMSKTKRNDNFFDLVDALTSVKNVHQVVDPMPHDYFADGSGARWLIAEYNKAEYTRDGAEGDGKRGRGGMYWALSRITPFDNVKTIGDAKDIWWPKVKVGGKMVDGAEAVDVYDILDHETPEALGAVVEETTRSILSPRRQEPSPRNDGHADGVALKVTWGELAAISDADYLVRLGCDAGGDADEIMQIANESLSLARRHVARLLGITPPRPGFVPRASAPHASDQTEGETEATNLQEDDEDLAPF